MERWLATDRGEAAHQRRKVGSISGTRSYGVEDGLEMHPSSCTVAGAYTYNVESIKATLMSPMACYPCKERVGSRSCRRRRRATQHSLSGRTIALRDNVLSCQSSTLSHNAMSVLSDDRCSRTAFHLLVRPFGGSPANHAHVSDYIELGHRLPRIPPLFDLHDHVNGIDSEGTGQKCRWRTHVLPGFTPWWHCLIVCP